jgi:hypothetical protein
LTFLAAPAAARVFEEKLKDIEFTYRQNLFELLQGKPGSSLPSASIENSGVIQFEAMGLRDVVGTVNADLHAQGTSQASIDRIMDIAVPILKPPVPEAGRGTESLHMRKK